MLFYIQIFSVVFSLITIYACLKWLRNNTLYRISLWAIALVVDAVVYFVYKYTGAGYLAIMLLVFIPFIFSRKRQFDEKIKEEDLSEINCENNTDQLSDKSDKSVSHDIFTVKIVKESVSMEIHRTNVKKDKKDPKK